MLSLRNSYLIFVLPEIPCKLVIAAWSLADLRRTDINQASMAAFLAALVGIPFPMNAVVSI